MIIMLFDCECPGENTIISVQSLDGDEFALNALCLCSTVAGAADQNKRGILPGQGSILHG